MNNTPDLGFGQLQAAARTVIACLQQIPEYANLQLLVIGGLAVSSYVNGQRPTKDIDFLITDTRAPTSVKDALYKHVEALFKKYPTKFVYCDPTGMEITINIIPPHQVPYIPTSAPRISTIMPGVIPYMAAGDLLALKIWSQGLRFIEEGRTKDEEDIRLLVHLWQGPYPIAFSTEQMQAIADGRADLIASGMDVQWLNAVLGPV